jgi:hypothetical protein
MKQHVLIPLLLMLLGLSGQAAALPIISLVPDSTKIHAGENLFIDVNVSGLQSGGSNSLLGAFSMDVLFNPELQFLPAGSGANTWGFGLGDVDAGDAVVGTPPFSWSPGSSSISFYEVSLLDSIDLSALQSDSFRLATLAFYLPFGNALTSGSYINFSTENVVLSDDWGNQFTTGVNPGATVQVPEPPMLLLLAIGLVPFWPKRKYQNRSNLNMHQQFCSHFVKISRIVSTFLFVTVAAHATPMSQTIEFNDHRYLLSGQGGLTWDQARLLAARDSVILENGTILKGHLLTISSQAEQDFIAQNFMAPFRHLSLGAYQFSSNVEPSDNWAWITGESVGNIQTDFPYTFLTPSQPGNDENPVSEKSPNLYNIEDSLQMLNFRGNSWDDFHRGDAEGSVNRFVIEFDKTGDNFLNHSSMPTIVSSSVWRSNNTFVSGWQNVNFDDSSWPSARDAYPIPRTASSLIPGTNAQFIWHDPTEASDGTTGSITAFFRYSFHQTIPSNSRPLLGKASIAVDDDYDLYVNGNLAFQNHDEGFADIVKTVDFSKFLQNGKNVIAVQAVDGGWSNPRDRLFESLLFDATVQPLADLLVISTANHNTHTTGEGRRFDGKAGVYLGHFGGGDNPLDMTYGPDQKLYVADTITPWGVEAVASVVRRFDGKTGIFDEIDDPYANFIPGTVGRFDFGPGGLAFGPDDNLYVSDVRDNSILRFQGPFGTNPGEFMDKFVATGNGGLSNPGRIAFGPDNNLYVLSNQRDVLRFKGPLETDHGSFIDNFVPNGLGGLTNVSDLLFGHDKRLYLLNRGPNTASPSGILKYEGPNSASPGSFINRAVTIDFIPSSFAIGPDWDFYVSGFGVLGGSGIVRYDRLNGTKKSDFVLVDRPSKIIFSSVPDYVANLGDFNNNACVDNTDLTIMLTVVNGPNPKPMLYDLNGDGKVNIADSRKLVTLFTNPRGAACN